MWDPIKCLEKIRKECPKSFLIISCLFPLLKHWQKTLLGAKTFAKTALKFWKEWLNIFRHLLEHKPLINFWNDNILTGLQWSFDVFESFLCTGVISATFSKEGNVNSAIESFRLVKIKSTKFSWKIWISCSFIYLEIFNFF